MLQVFTQAQRHQNESYADISFIKKENDRRWSRILALPESSSPLLRAIAESLRRELGIEETVQQAAPDSSRLVEYLLKNRHKQQLRSVVFTSAGKNDGTESVVLNLARHPELLQGVRVLIIDANITSPGLSKHLGAVAMSAGLLDVLAGESSLRGVLQKLSGADIYFLGRGRKRRNSAALISEQRLREILAYFETLFDFIIIAAPPLQHSRDALVWGRLAGGMVLVVHTPTTRLQRIKQIKKEAQDNQVRILGTILSKKKKPIPRLRYEWI